MELLGIDLAIIAPLLIIEAILAIVAIIAWFKTDETNGPKWLWLLLIIFISIIGPILFFIIGRRQN
ncbi:PLDc N-terminal domain-containing protein [Aquibacillus rhizosphaerae]|uniref:PLDc N-terminal domain-containing protein n=1 Tax=Aquibacillus rhizosphaerae TaxID=3051431 RepID=A0ABT7L9I1_9BACI|nr:PLDc N-terminal domain-containing protein [Aquibacillus sp. LR5S19]MDL4841850.1 PLDc N-terminal domain-containing protein [Aquibacillus sp. LR5S19]